MIEVFLQRFSARVSLLLLCDPDVSEVETVRRVLTSRRQLLVRVKVSRWLFRSNNHNFELSSHPYTQRLIGCLTYLSATEMRQLLVRSSKRRVNFLIIISLNVVRAL